MSVLNVAEERTLDSRLELGDERALAVRFETEAPVDDLLVETTGPG